jgi:hypothetical protein
VADQSVIVTTTDNDAGGPNYDVTGDGLVNVLDILAIVNWMTINGVKPTTPETANYDTTQDGLINALDILAIVNYLTELFRSGEGEGEKELTPAQQQPPADYDLLQLLAEDVAAERRRRTRLTVM